MIRPGDMLPSRKTVTLLLDRVYPEAARKAREFASTHRWDPERNCYVPIQPKEVKQDD